MKTSAIGIKKIAVREGTVLRVYKDSKGLPTAGVGHLIKDDERADFPLGKKITQAQSDAWLAEDLQECEDAVNGIGVKLEQNEFDALVSLAFNIGVGGFKKSSVVRRLKAGDKSGAAEAILLWNKPPEIQGRRRTEYNQFKTPYKISAVASIVAQTTSEVPQNSAIESHPSEQPPTAIVENIENANLEAPKPLPQIDPVTVKAETTSIWAKIGAGIAAITGLGINFGNLVTTKLNEITPAQLGYVLAGLAIIGVGLWLYDRAARRAHEKTLAKVATAADPSQNTVEFKK